MGILQSFCVLLLAQLAGEVLHRLLHIPVPGPALGMALLAAALLMHKREPGPELTKTANGLLSWLAMLFVPAGVGIFASIGLLRAAWLPTIVALVGSTMLTLAVTALVMHVLLRRRGVQQQPEIVP